MKSNLNEKTGKEQQIRIQASGGLSDEDIERMVVEAEQHADDDKQRRELVEVRNTADSLIHASEKNLKEYSDKVSDEDKSVIENAIGELKNALEGDDVDTIKAKTDALNEAAMKLGESMYKASQAEVAEAASATETNNDADGDDGGEDATVVDADFEEVDPDDEQDHDQKDD